MSRAPYRHDEECGHARVTSADIHALRKRINCGLMEAKEALERRDCLMEYAEEYIRRSGLAAVLSFEGRYPKWAKYLRAKHEPTREEVHEFDGLDTDQLRDALVALCKHLNVKLIRVTDPQWPEGHPNRVSFEIEPEEEVL